MEGCLILISEPVHILQQSQSGTLLADYGGSVGITIEAEGNPAPKYLWYKYNAPMMEQCSNTLNILNIRLFYANFIQK